MYSDNHNYPEVQGVPLPRVFLADDPGVAVNTPPPVGGLPTCSLLSGPTKHSALFQSAINDKQQSQNRISHKLQNDFKGKNGLLCAYPYSKNQNRHHIKACHLQAKHSKKHLPTRIGTSNSDPPILKECAKGICLSNLL